jgi:hypothetical protein
MHPTDPLSTNLFARLFAYTPRSDARKPIEDFCTEALAWCLLSSKGFCEKFLKFLKVRLSESDTLGSNFRRFGQEIDIGTQISFRADPEDEEAGDEQDSSRGRFDIMIRPIAGQSFILVIESKVSFDKGMDSQIGDYVLALNDPKLRFARYAERYVVSLTPWTPDISKKHARLTWQDVHRLLEEEASDTPNSVVRQFSEFLKHRNLSSLKLMKLETRQIGQLKSNSSLTQGTCLVAFKTNPS